MRKTLLTLVILLGTAAPGYAQWVVYDSAVTYRNTVTAALKEVLIRLQQQQHSELRRMAHRLSMFTTLAKFRVPDPPRWRTHDFEGPAFLFARGPGARAGGSRPSPARSGRAGPPRPAG